MTEATNLDKIRGEALDRIERSNRNYRLAFLGAVVIEILFLFGFILLADFSNRMHLLLLIATVATYSIIALGLLALGSHISRNTQLVLKSIELLEKQITCRMNKLS